MGSRNHVLDGGPDAPCEGTIFREKDGRLGMPDDTAVSCAKMAETIEMPFGLWTWVGPRKQVECILTPPGEYDRTVHMRRRCGFFVKLLLLDTLTTLIVNKWSK